jgi:hypothetical protein
MSSEPTAVHLPVQMPVQMPVQRRTWMTLEPIHGMVYFTPHGGPIYDALGLTARQHYFAPRMAAAGAASAELTIATFYNFSPALVRAAVPSAWSVASPNAILDARYRVVDASLREAGGALLGTAEIARAAALAKRAALVACESLDGRPLFAAHAALPWPEEDHLVLWHAQTLLREFRGDGHIALLVSEGLSGLEALLSHAATGAVPGEVLKSMRGWTDDEWNAGIESMRAKGLLVRSATDAIAFTPLGVEQRDRIEARTDVLAAAPYLVLGDDECAELRASARPLAQAILASGWLPIRRPLPE